MTLMVYDDSLQVGDRVDLSITKNDGTENVYISQVQSIQDQDHIIVAGPIEKGRIVFLSVGQILKVLYYKPKGYYFFEARIVERYKLDEDIYSYAIEAIGPRRRMQRRNYFRLHIVLPVQFRKMDEGDGVEERWYRAYTLDISGGGMRMAVSKRININKGDVLQCRIALDADRSMDICGRIIRISASDEEPLRQDVGVEFQDISNNVRDQLIKFIFEQQIILRRKGLE